MCGYAPVAVAKV